jgi:hypothetical protein
MNEEKMTTKKWKTSTVNLNDVNKLNQENAATIGLIDNYKKGVAELENALKGVFTDISTYFGKEDLEAQAVIDSKLIESVKYSLNNLLLSGNSLYWQNSALEYNNISSDLIVNPIFLKALIKKKIQLFMIIIVILKD